MRAVVFYITYPLILVLSYLPFWLLYRISDGLYYVIFYLVGYRKKLVYNNLKKSFPEKSETEILRIQKAFYRHFADFLVETLKTFSISNKQLHKRFVYQNLELITDYTQRGKTVLIVGGHYANWEWVIGAPDLADLNVLITYTRITNPFFNRWIKRNRERFGVKMILKQETYKAIAENHANKLPSVYGLLSDQSPSVKKAKYWTHFLGHKVPVYTSAESIAKKYDDVVVYMHIDKVKRGHYEVHFDLISDEAGKHEDFTLTDQFFQILNKHILEKPELYLWTHNRFKHVGKEPK